ncbi:MAG: hypothetical protein IPH16_00115 [Haliscomenobacter sp.]|nr:hypothetical protein [Haliscomenobacter sp.]
MRLLRSNNWTSTRKSRSFVRQSNYFCPPLMEQEQLAVTTELLAQDFAIEGAPGGNL